MEAVETQPVTWENEPSSLEDGATDQEVASLLMAYLLSVPWGQPVMAEELVGAMQRASRPTSLRRVHGAMRELVAHTESDPIWPAKVLPRGRGYILVPKTTLHQCLRNGWSAWASSCFGESAEEREDLLAVFAAVLYWPHGKPPTINHLAAIFGWSAEKTARLVDRLRVEGWVYETWTYDSFRRIGATRTVLDQLGLRGRGDLPKWEEMRAALVPGESDPVESA